MAEKHLVTAHFPPVHAADATPDFKIDPVRYCIARVVHLRGQVTVFEAGKAAHLPWRSGPHWRAVACP